MVLGSDGDGGVVRRTVLPGGLRVVTQTLPAARSVTYGVWVGVGSRDEGRTQAGASHYLEHLLFKGTRRRNALEISAAIDAVGGEMNAFTGKEYTCYYARVLDTDLPLAIDVVSDLVTSSRVATRDVESERGVILEEIAMHDDDPADEVHDEFASVVFGDSPLGRPILGTVESIEGLSRSTIHRYYTGRYRPQDMVVAVAGSLAHDDVVAQVRAAFGAAGFLDGDSRPSRPRTDKPGGGKAFDADGLLKVVSRPTEQANVLIGVPGVSRTDERRYALGVLNTALGGGMSSRLFQEVREKRGLAYSVYSGLSHYADAGLFSVYAGCLPPKIDEVLRICRDELAAVATDGLTEEELARGKGQLRGNIVLGLEDPAARMMRLGKTELLSDEWLSIGQTLDRIAAVTAEEVEQVCAEMLAERPSVAIVGPFDEDRNFAAAVA